MPLKNSCSIHEDAPKAVWSIPYVSVAFFPSLKHNFIAYRSSKVSDCIFEIHQLWQSGFSRVYSNFWCSCSFEPEIIKTDQSSHTMYNNNIVNIQESTTILNASTKILETYWRHHVNRWKWKSPLGYLPFLIKYLFRSYIRVCFKLVSFVRDHWVNCYFWIWHKAIWMGLHIRLELIPVGLLVD